MKKKALITGITGQDGSYLGEYLLGLGYEVHGIVRVSLWRSLSAGLVESAMFLINSCCIPPTWKAIPVSFR